MKQEKDKDGFVTVCSTEQYGGYGKLKIKVLIDVDRDITKIETNEIRNKMEDMIGVIHTTTIQQNPDTLKEKSTQRDVVELLFKGHTIFIKEIPNEYNPNSPYYKHFPWYIITTKLGHFKVGWRKRVIEINWQETLINTLSEVLFKDEDVTKDYCMIHAWGPEKAQEYIDKLISQNV